MQRHTAALREHQQDLERHVKERTHALQVAKEETDAILKSMPEGVVVVDSAGLIERINPRFAQMVELEEGDLTINIYICIILNQEIIFIRLVYKIKASTAIQN